MNQDSHYFADFKNQQKKNTHTHTFQAFSSLPKPLCHPLWNAVCATFTAWRLLFWAIFLLSQTVSQNVMFASFFFCNPYIKCHCQRESREVFGGYVTCWPRGDADGLLSSCYMSEKHKRKGLKTAKSTEYWTAAVTLWACSGFRSQPVDRGKGSACRPLSRLKVYD